MALFYGKFDANAYYDANPDVKRGETNAEQHWALSGITEGRAGYIVGVALSGQFDATGYLNCNPDVRNAGLDAKDHYKNSGWTEKRDICLWVDAIFEPSGTWLHLARAGEIFSIGPGDYVVVPARINVRAQPSGNATWVRFAVQGEVLHVVNVAYGWAKLADGKYVFADFISLKTPTPTPTPTPIPTPKPTPPSTDYVVVPTRINVRMQPDSNSAWVRFAVQDEVLHVVIIANGWAQLTDGTYVFADYIIIKTGIPTATPTPTPIPTPSAMVRYGAATQWVTKQVSGSVQCTNEFFGIDPTFGIVKSCQALVAGPEPGVTWSRIGAQGEKITLDGTRTVRYGAGAQWIIKLLSGSVECTNAFFGGDPAPHIPKICEVLGPDEMNGNWVHIASEGQRFSIIGTQTVRYGAGTQWITKVLAGLGECTSVAFGGDPTPGIVKSCEVWTPALKVSPVVVLDFDGVDDYVEVFEANAPLDNHTIEAWVKPDRMNGGIVSWGLRDHKNLAVELSLSDRGVVHRWLDSSLFVTTHSLAGKWHQLAATFDGQEQCIYLDGELVGNYKPAQGRKTLEEVYSQAGKAEPLGLSNNFRIGITNPDNYFDGKLSEIRIWDRARSKDEIRNDMLHRLIGDEPGLVGYWCLNNRGEGTEHILGAAWEFDENLELVIDPSFYYRLTTMWQGDGKSLHILNDGGNNLPVLAGTGDYASQYWKITPLGKNYYRLTNRWLGPQKSLDIINDGVNNKPIMADTGNYDGQFLKLTLFQNGYYRISTHWQGEGKSLDIVNDGQNNKIILADNRDFSGQFWKLTRTDVVVGDKDGIGLGSGTEYNGDVCNAQSAGCMSQGCATQGDQGCAGQGCMAQSEGCITQGCVAQVDGCAAQGCIGQAEGCYAQGCAAQVQGCAGQGCVAQAAGCAAQGCAAQAEGCVAQGCIAQAEGCAAQACAAQVEGCAAQACAAQVEGCAAQACAAKAEGCAAQACAAQAEGCAAQGCAAQAEGCAAKACAAQAEGCAAEGCAAQAEGCAAKGCTAQAGCVAHGCAAQAGACAAQGCAGDGGCAAKGCAVDACAAQGCAGHACAVDVGTVCVADGQLGPCVVDLPYCPIII
jgi:hypothetical protein